MNKTHPSSFWTGASHLTWAPDFDYYKSCNGSCLEIYICWSTAIFFIQCHIFFKFGLLKYLLDLYPDHSSPVDDPCLRQFEHSWVICDHHSWTIYLTSECREQRAGCHFGRSAALLEPLRQCQSDSIMPGVDLRLLFRSNATEWERVRDRLTA